MEKSIILRMGSHLFLSGNLSVYHPLGASITADLPADDRVRVELDFDPRARLPLADKILHLQLQKN